MNTESILNMNKGLDDYFLGPFHLNEERIQHKSSQDEYIGLNPDALMTPYLDYYNILSDIPEGERLVDLGTGYGRGIFLSEALGLYNCIGIESVKERVDYIRDKLKDSESIIHADLLNCELPQAYGYYLYFPKGVVLNRIIQKLYLYSKDVDVYIYVCESHGDVIEYIQSFRRIFKTVTEIPVSLPRHFHSIVKFKINYLDHTSLEFPEKCLLGYLDDRTAVVEYANRLTNEKNEWALPLIEHDLILYNGNYALKNLKSNRIIEIYRDEPLLRVD